MTKSVLLKDLYQEIERMKQGSVVLYCLYLCKFWLKSCSKLVHASSPILQTDVRAAREKNGVYVPHERFVQEEAEKKVGGL